MLGSEGELDLAYRVFQVSDLLLNSLEGSLDGSQVSSRGLISAGICWGAGQVPFKLLHPVFNLRGGLCDGL